MMLDEISLMADALAVSPSISPCPSGYADDPRAGNPRPPRDKDKKVGGLVLTRHLGESIMIGEDVEVQVVGLKAGTARLKVVAPRTIQVHRREVFDSIQTGEPRPVHPSPTAPARPRPGQTSGGLVLARSAFQSIMIGDDVEVAVVEVRPSIVKLKVSAPRSVAVHRREIFDRLDAHA